MADIEAIIRAAAARRGVDPETLLQVARLESGLNPRAKNPKSSAGGLFQFIDGTAKQYGLDDKYDAYASADAGAALMADNTAGLRKSLGREPSPGELYLAHQQGLGGATSLLSNPSSRAADVVGSAAVNLNGGNPRMSAMDFTNLWNGKMAKGLLSSGQIPTSPYDQSVAGVGPVSSSPYEQAVAGPGDYSSPVPVRTYAASGVGTPGTTLNTSMGSSFDADLNKAIQPQRPFGPISDFFNRNGGTSGMGEMSKVAGGINELADGLGLGGSSTPAPQMQAPAASMGNPNAASSQSAQALLTSLMESKKFRPRGLTLGA